MAKAAGTTKQRKEKDFLRKPRYEGGSKALGEFISTHLHYPAEALQNGVQGDVHVKFDVSEEGEVLSAKIARSLGAGCDEEALRIVKMLKYTPARNRKAHVTTHHDIVIHFRLPAPPPQTIQQQVQIQYSYVPLQGSVQDVGAQTLSKTVFSWTVQPKNK